MSSLKSYEAIRAGNVGCLQFLVNLARGPASGNVKASHYLSTWGVPHLRAWHTTELTSPGYLTGEEMTNMKPGAEITLDYLKCRWVCESILYQAARCGLPVNTYRSCMVGANKSSQQGLDRTDINRRIIKASLQIGHLLDFNSSQGGGMN
jgi:thioester reductase-like protein